MLELKFKIWNLVNKLSIRFQKVQTDYLKAILNNKSSPLFVVALLSTKNNFEIKLFVVVFLILKWHLERKKKN